MEIKYTNNMRAPAIDEEELQLVYQWVDSVPLTRPKKNISRDFADGGTFYGISDAISANGGNSV
jgi:hypothetical protein